MNFPFPCSRRMKRNICRGTPGAPSQETGAPFLLPRRFHFFFRRWSSRISTTDVSLSSINDGAPGAPQDTTVLRGQQYLTDKYRRTSSGSTVCTVHTLQTLLNAQQLVYSHLTLHCFILEIDSHQYPIQTNNSYFQYSLSSSVFVFLYLSHLNKVCIVFLSLLYNTVVR